ncbi:indoleamine 2,3-dioxygenase [Acaricomes phytoseiuli]|uniref:hypothetical protein n=1 Tax=Acaricomes phytoseiuli TaxID=291968 RepID=UPI000365C9C2|nr:hypothetical protein [Acaricomes phytoseiuli]MCW1248993.1 indoleamine 2,3-dioxygenase [Acaricomes phytoseiuli]
MTSQITGLAPLDFSASGVDQIWGFLPSPAPVTALPPEFGEWDEFAAELPKALRVGSARRLLAQLPPLDPVMLTGTAQPAQILPANIALPWCRAAEQLGRPPILSYATHVLQNWRCIDPLVDPEPENLHRIQDFLGGMDDDWFVLIHVAIEVKAAPGLLAMTRAQEAAGLGDLDTAAAELLRVSESLVAMTAVLSRMPERCDPYIYYNRVRMFMFGWLNNPDFPDGLHYEGVPRYSGPQRLHGETGAQSSIIPFLGNALGVDHEADPLNDFMLALRAYLPPEHKAFIDDVGGRVDLRGIVRTSGDNASLEAYNSCIEQMRDFHELHLRYAAQYVHKQGRACAANGAGTGTGGTPFMKYLKLHLDNISAHRIGAAG